MDEARRNPYLRSWQERWTVQLLPAGRQGRPPLVRWETGHRAETWEEAAIVEARVKGITVEEVLEGKLDPALEAARARRRIERRRDLVRCRNWLLFAVLVLVAGAAFCAWAGWWPLTTFYCILGIFVMRRVPEEAWSLPLRIPSR